MFISHAVYDYQFDEELSIASYYTPFRQEGADAANRLILSRHTPDWLKDNAYSNLVFYAENLPNTEYQPIDIKLPRLREGLDEYYYPMNPSLQKTAGGYSLICRAVNWSQTGGKYRSRDPEDDKIRTKNFLVKYDTDFNLLSQKEILENLPRKKYPSQVQGLEDCRLIQVNSEDWFICSSFDHKPGAICQTLCKLGGVAAADSINVYAFVPLDAQRSRCEKNWLPFCYQGQLCVVYFCDPFTVYQINKTSGECKIIKEYTPPCDLSRFRGSAAPVEFDDGYLMLVHEVVFKDQRCYLHRFVYLDQELNVKKLSKPFTFQHTGIEYCCGMAIDHTGTQCILSVGIEDREALLCKTNLETIRSMLEPIPNS